MGIIVRTTGSNKTKNEIENDLNNLIKVWDQIKENALNSIAPSLIHQESDIIKDVLGICMMMIPRIFMLRAMKDIRKQKIT